MKARILKPLMYLISSLLAFGNFEILFGLKSEVGLIHVVLVLFATTYFIFYPKDVVLAFKKSRALYLIGILLLLSLSQLLYGESSYPAPIFNIKLLACILFFLVLISYFKRFPKNLHLSLLVFSIASVLFATLFIFVIPSAAEVYKGQLIVLGENPNSTSSRLVVAFIYLLAFCIKNPFGISRKRYLILLFLIPLGILIVLSGSRGSLLAALVSTYFFLLLSKINLRYKISILLSSILAVPYLINYLMTTEGISERWASASEGDTAGRGDIWSSAFTIFLSSPIIGVGEAGYFQEIYYARGQYIDTHNIFIYLAVCGGVLALLLFMIFIYSLFVRARISFKYGDVLPFIFLINMLLIASKTGGVLTYLLMWYMFSIIYSYKNTYQRF